MPTETERRNLEVIPKWLEYYNHDVTRMVKECYAPDCIVDCKGGISWQGHEAFILIEEAVEKASPHRKAEVLETIAAGDRVIVQAVLKDPSKGADWKAPFCAILTFRDGLIIKDESYMDLRVWPSPKLSREEWKKIPLLNR